MTVRTSIGRCTKGRRVAGARLSADRRSSERTALLAVSGAVNYGVASLRFSGRDVAARPIGFEVINLRVLSFVKERLPEPDHPNVRDSCTNGRWSDVDRSSGPLGRRLSKWGLGYRRLSERNRRMLNDYAPGRGLNQIRPCRSESEGNRNEHQRAGRQATAN